MKELHEVGILSRLPRVELAKLVTDIQRVHVQKGDFIKLSDDGRDYVFIIHSGRVGVFMGIDAMQATLITLGKGEVFGEGLSNQSPSTVLGYQAIEGADLYRLERTRFQQVLSQHPDSLREFSDAMVRQSNLIIEELARTKSALLYHAAEVWAALEETSQSEAAVAASESMVSRLVRETPAPVASKKTIYRLHNGKRLTIYGSPILAALLTYVIGNPRLTFEPVRASLAILVWGVLSWLLDALPDYVVALTIGLVAAVAGIVKPEIAFSGFSSKTWLLLLAVLGISAGISHVGLLYRVALHMLKLLPSTYVGQSVAMALGGFLIAPFLPGVTGRQALASRLSLELSEAMGFKAKSRGAAGLAMACFVGFSCLYFGSMTGGSVTLIVWSVVPAAVQATMSWSSWFAAALPVSLFVFIATVFAVLRMYKPETQVRIPADVVDSQLRILGPMSRPEWITVWVVLAVVAAFITQPLHGVDPTWVALPGFLLLSATGIVDKQVLRKGIDWGFLLLTGGLLGIVALTGENGFTKLIGGTIVPLIEPLASSPWLFITAIAVLTAIIHLVVPFQPTILLTAITLMPVARNLGYNPFLVGLVILIMASHFVVPHSNPMYMAAYGGSEESFSHKQTFRLSLVHALITLVGVWLSIPYWHWIGLL